MTFKDYIEFQNYMQSILSSQRNMAQIMSNYHNPAIKAWQNIQDNHIQDNHPDNPEHESIKLSPETMKLLMEEPSQIGAVIRSINKLSDKIDENQQKAEEQAIKQLKIAKINCIIGVASGIAAIVAAIVAIINLFQ